MNYRNLPNRIRVDEFCTSIKNAGSNKIVCVNSPSRANGYHYLEERVVMERLRNELKRLCFDEDDIQSIIKRVVKRK